MGASYTVAKVRSTEAEEAFEFHRGVANDHIWPRSLEEIRRYCEDGSLHGARSAETGKFVALCYAVLTEDEKAWEVGGLTVHGSVQREGIGTFLVRFALAHTMVFVQPWENEQEVIAHVHQANDEPRRLLDRLGFEVFDRVELPGADAPLSMKRNAEGKVVGDVFRFTRAGLRRLSDWFNQEFDGTLGQGGAAVRIDLGPVTLDDLKDALVDMVGVVEPS